MSHHWSEGPEQFHYQTENFAGPDFSAGLHTFAVEWAPDEITWFVDGNQRHHTKNQIPEVPMYLNIALAVGGQFAGLPDETTPSSARMEIDCIKVFSSTEVL
jgi:beta-glucanase (GH16 family)